MMFFKLITCNMLLVHIGNYIAQSTDIPCNEGEYDCRGVQIPIDTETTRDSDGISSVSATTVTSPAFPQYQGLNDMNEINRAAHMFALSKNAASQGVVTDPDVGDARIEDARLSIAKSSLPPPRAYFSVSSSIKFNPSQFMIQKGERYNVTVTGVNQWNDGLITTNANGYMAYYDAVQDCFMTQNTCYSHLKSRPRFEAAPWFSLICTVGTIFKLMGEIEPGNELAATFVNVDEAELNHNQFYVGSSYVFLSNHTGELICYANDNFNFLWNNQGTLNVSVVRTSWPVTNATYYTDFYIPECDSALVVYDAVTCSTRMEALEDQWIGQR